MANGMCNFVSSFFSAYVSAASLSRSLVQDTAGGKTQVHGRPETGREYRGWGYLLLSRLALGFRYHSMT